MYQNYILDKVVSVILDCGILSYPINCIEIIEHYDYKVFTYSQIKQKNPHIYDLCRSYSEDAFHDGVNKIIVINDENCNGRIRFSLMHELGHIVCGHRGNEHNQEIEANYFASNILAPRIAIHYARCKSATEVSKIFCITHEAAKYAFEDYQRWRHTATIRMSKHDKVLYTHFYHQEYNGFVYNIEKCICCGRHIYNTPGKERCFLCNYRLSNNFSYNPVDDPLSADNIILSKMFYA